MWLEFKFTPSQTLSAHGFPQWRRASGLARERKARVQLPWLVFICCERAGAHLATSCPPRSASCFMSGLPQGGAHRASPGAARRTGRCSAPLRAASLRARSGHGRAGAGRCALTAAGQPQAGAGQPCSPPAPSLKCKFPFRQNGHILEPQKKLQCGFGTPHVWGHVRYVADVRAPCKGSNGDLDGE